MNRIIYIGGLLLFSALLGQAEVILSDSFDYTNGPLTNVSEGKWQQHSGKNTEPVDIIFGRAFLSQLDSQDVNRNLNKPYGTNSGAVLYASLTINFTNLPSAKGAYFAHFRGGNNGNSHYCRIFAFANEELFGFFRVGIANSNDSASAVLCMNLALRTNYTMVARYVVSNAVSTLWINPTSESDAGATATDAAPAINIFDFAFRQEAGMGDLFVDNLVVTSNAPNLPPSIATPPQNQVVNDGATVTFTVEASGTPPFAYQWQFNGSDLAGATAATLSLTNVSSSQAGSYRVMVSNVAGSTNSDTATLSIIPAFVTGPLTILTYNVHGFGQADWSTNSLQVQAIGRQMAYLHPDIITFNEIPYAHTWQMTNFVAAYLPGYFLATNSGTDFFHSTRSVIASRFPIMRSTSWLDGADLNPFGFTNGNFTRDLFEAQIAVPNFPQPLHVFTTHLKATDSSQDDAGRRAAEASAISNFFVTVFLTTNADRPYVLTGDLNEDIDRSPAGSLGPVERLVSAPTGLHLTTPRDPFDNDDRTISIQDTSLSKRFDYILPGGLLYSNIVGSQVFRTDKLNPTPPALQQFDDRTASDHLPVLMVFNNPYETPFRLALDRVSGQSVSLQWDTSIGGRYDLQVSSDLTTWTAFATNLLATGTGFTLNTNLQNNKQFFRVYRLP